ncbi:TetR family transcriptional regulator [Mycobacterium sp. ITM-2017-0098]|nr:TetR family transcriptional regulator [Mycobacterium sp. ITM-2017-0098]
MSERGRSADPRAERVRARLRDAAFSLPHERPVDEITVGDLVARAGVSRQVFYRHFRDRDDAVAQSFSHAFAEAGAPRDGADARTRVVDLFAFAAEHSSLCRNVVPSTVNQHVLATYRDALFAPCQLIAAQGMAVLDSVAPLPEEAVARFLVGGFMEVLRSWMEDPDSTDLPARVTAALDTVDALLGISSSQKGPADG